MFRYPYLVLMLDGSDCDACCMSRLDLLLQDRLDQLGSADVLLQRKLVQALQQLGFHL